MLRVAVNGFFESVGVVLGVMKDLDTDTVYQSVTESMQGVQGLEEVKSWRKALEIWMKTGAEAISRGSSTLMELGDEVVRRDIHPRDVQMYGWNAAS
jgi:hypothetical protein